MPIVNNKSMSGYSGRSWMRKTTTHTPTDSDEIGTHHNGIAAVQAGVKNNQGIVQRASTADAAAAAENQQDALSMKNPEQPLTALSTPQASMASVNPGAMVRACKDQNGVAGNRSKSSEQDQFPTAPVAPPQAVCLPPSYRQAGAYEQDQPIQNIDDLVATLDELSSVSSWAA